MLFLLALAAAAPAPAAATAAAPAPCVTMMTDRMSLAKRASKLDSLSFKVGAAEVKLCYSAPQLKGRKMIGAEAVPYGKLWRTGANEPTMLHTTGTIMVGSVMLPAGSYSVYTIPGETSWKVIFNRSITQWGHESSYTAEVKAKEVGTTDAKAEKTAAPVEALTFTVTPNATNASAIVLSWDSAKVTIPVMAH